MRGRVAKLLDTYYIQILIDNGDSFYVRDKMDRILEVKKENVAFLSDIEYEIREKYEIDDSDHLIITNMLNSFYWFLENRKRRMYSDVLFDAILLDKFFMTFQYSKLFFDFIQKRGISRESVFKRLREEEDGKKIYKKRVN